MRCVALLLIALLAGCGESTQATFQGYVEGEFVYVASSQAGRLDSLLVQRGQQVTAKLPLFALESANEAAAQQQARRQLEAAEAQLKDLQTGKRPPELDVIHAQLAQAQAQAHKAALQLARDREQYAVGGIARAQLDDSQASADSSAAQVRELQSQLIVGKLPGRDEQLRAQAAQVAAARAALAQADWKLDQKAVMATRSGRVFDTMYRPGEWVPAGSPVVRLLPPENIKLRFFVPEPVLGRLAVGQAVSVRCDGCKAALPAKITYVATEAEYTPPVIYSNESRAKLVYLIEAHPAVADAPTLHPGQPVEVALQ
ncbi:HlyD family efflux transporter periplasmic adaptor subunit [Crenobacter sp. SG2303]|uniref:HlyD family efflux transporter periplasmic adaptor subunit n=1 Tax=Crenobacter oryzisoli TaxID=3056844 RepID=A0ABT7XN19_9NEIS|nr:HlyD family secretion protein [Crenobacter sp. SG2303]MDN0075192.1 HlyD family efflux transporter periplasmic adaptor subunit [Crenobacter sp. SG2303]